MSLNIYQGLFGSSGSNTGAEVKGLLMEGKESGELPVVYYGRGEANEKDNLPPVQALQAQLETSLSEYNNRGETQLKWQLEAR